MERRLSDLKVSIIIRTCDRALLLERAIKSIIAQTYTNWEVILINNGGDMLKVKELTDGYKKYLLDRIKVIDTNGNYPMEAATNIGLKNSSGKYIALLDDDDTWEKDFLKQCVDILENDNVHAVATQTSIIYEDINDNDIIYISKEKFNPNLRKVTLLKILKHNYFTTNSFVYEKSNLQETGLYREDLKVLGDWEFNIRFLLKYNIKIISRPLANYHKRLNLKNSSYCNSNISLHDYYDRRIRKEYFKKFISEGEYLYAALILSFRIINNIKNFITKIIRK